MKQLRFTTMEPLPLFGIATSPADGKLLVKPENVGELVKDKVMGTKAYIHDDAMDLAGFDIPVFLDGNFSQLDLPEDQQDILMLLPDGEYPCKAEFDDGTYYIVLKK